MSPEAAQGWPLPEDVHPGPDGQARSRRRRVHPGAARVVRDLEEAVCGKCWSRAGHVRQIDDCMLIRSGRWWVFRFIFFFSFSAGTRRIQIHLAAEGDAGPAGKPAGAAVGDAHPGPNVRPADEGHLQD